MFEGAPIHKVESKKHLKWMKVDNVSAKKVIGTILALTEVMEGNTKGEMKDKKGSIFYGSWTNAGVHCLSLFGVYMVEGRQKIVLLGVCPIPVAKTEDVGDGDTELVRKLAYLHWVHLFVMRFNTHASFCTTQWSTKFNAEAIVR